MLVNRKGIEDVREALANLWAPVRRESVVDCVENKVEVPHSHLPEPCDQVGALTAIFTPIRTEYETAT